MITDPDLAAAIEGRDHWQATGEDAAEYDPGQPALVRVRVGRIRNPPRTGPTRHDRYYGVVVKQGRAMYSVSFGFAQDAIRWAERQRLS